MMNKYQKALWNIIQSLTDHRQTDNHGQDLNIIKELIEKATPKKPIKKELWHGGITCKCPKCEHCLTSIMLPGLDYYKFCPECGQKIDWEETE